MFEIYDVAIIPLILAVVQLAKGIGLPAKASPIVAVVFGLIIGIVYLDGSVEQNVLVGLMLGLSATGLYSGAKNVTQVAKPKEGVRNDE